jgi:RNA polymerase II-associated factor 1
MNQYIDVSRGAQIRDIEASFAACNDNFSLHSIQHPNKQNVTAVESYEIFPDSDIWANAYDLFRFSERPTDARRDRERENSGSNEALASTQTEDPRLDCAILRPMEAEGDHFLAYYLTKDVASAIAFKKARFDPNFSYSDIKEASHLCLPSFLGMHVLT